MTTGVGRSSKKNWRMTFSPKDNLTVFIVLSYTLLHLLTLLLKILQKYSLYGLHGWILQKIKHFRSFLTTIHHFISPFFYFLFLLTALWRSTNGELAKVELWYYITNYLYIWNIGKCFESCCVDKEEHERHCLHLHER